MECLAFHLDLPQHILVNFVVLVHKSSVSFKISFVSILFLFAADGNRTAVFCFRLLTISVVNKV